MLPILRMISVGGVSLAIVILLLALAPPEDSRLHLARVAASARGPLLDRHGHPEWRQFLIHAALRRADELLKLQDLPDTPVKVAPMPVEAIAPAAVPVPEIGESRDIAPAPATSPPEPAEDKVVGLPPERKAADPDDVTGSIGRPQDEAGIPVEIGEASSTELPVIPMEEMPPVIRMPQRETPHESLRLPPRKPPQAQRPQRQKLQASRTPQRKKAQRSRRPRIHSARQAKPAPKPQEPAPMNLFQALAEAFKPKPDSGAVTRATPLH